MVGNATLHVSCGSLTLCYLYLLSLIPGHTQSVGVQCFSVSLDFLMSFLYCRCICTLSLDPLFLAVGQFQSWDWLWYPLTCGPRGEIWVYMKHNSRFKFLPWPGFEPMQS